MAVITLTRRISVSILIPEYSRLTVRVTASFSLVNIPLTGQVLVLHRTALLLGGDDVETVAPITEQDTTSTGTLQ